MSSNVDPAGHVNTVSSARFLHNKGNRIWHVDSSFKRNGAEASLLYAEIVLVVGDQSEKQRK